MENKLPHPTSERDEGVRKENALCPTCGYLVVLNCCRCIKFHGDGKIERNASTHPASEVEVNDGDGNYSFEPHPAPKGDWIEEWAETFCFHDMVLSNGKPWKCSLTRPCGKHETQAEIQTYIKSFISRLLAEREKAAEEKWKNYAYDTETQIHQAHKESTLSAYKVVGEWAEKNKKPADWKNPGQPKSEYANEIGFNQALSSLQSFLKDKTK